MDGITVTDLQAVMRRVIRESEELGDQKCPAVETLMFLLEVYRTPGRNQIELQERLGFSQSAVSRNCTAYSVRGGKMYVRLEIDPDNLRARCVFLTGAGVDFVERVLLGRTEGRA